VLIKSNKVVLHWNSDKIKGAFDIVWSFHSGCQFSGEQATYLFRRYIEIKVYGLTYREFLTFHGLETGRESLQQYIKYGELSAMPWSGFW
jgi:predicted AAA+ superfamily ATPase